MKVDVRAKSGREGQDTKAKLKCREKKIAQEFVMLETKGDLENLCFRLAFKSN